MKKEMPEKTKKSSFHLTISTNQKYADDDPHLQNDSEVFDEVMSDILNNIEHYVKLPEGHSWDAVNDADIDYILERGKHKLGSRLHAHVLFRFNHRTKLQLDYQKIKDKICGELGLHDVYLHNRLVRPTEGQNILSYLSKYET
jgi:hypothetical protein